MVKVVAAVLLQLACADSEASSMLTKAVGFMEMEKKPQHKHTNRHAKSHNQPSLAEVAPDTTPPPDTICSNSGIYKATWAQGEESDAIAPPDDYAVALDSWNDASMTLLMSDLKTMFTTEHACWPTDAGHYGPFMVRLAWHASGSFRSSDNKGGAAGGRMRFFPEANWPDNGNLDKARSLLAPIKTKFGAKLSWGDLYILAGTLAIVDMGGPCTTFCFGRIDDASGADSMTLNCDPSMLDHDITSTGDVGSRVRCDTNPDKKFSQDEQGLIYVNAQGPNGDPNPYMSSQDIKRTFSRMGMNWQQTAALVGGGHSFGQSHALAGEKGNVKTAGFEGAWTNNPTDWDNEYYKALIEEDWEAVETKVFDAQVAVKHPAHAAIQWQTVNRTSVFKDTMMTTADIGIKAHPDFSLHAVKYASHLSALESAFREAWELLTTRGSGWVSTKKCYQLEDFY